MPMIALHTMHGTWSLKSGLTLNTNFATALLCVLVGKLTSLSLSFPPLENENIDTFVIDVLGEFNKRIFVKYLK